MPTNATIDLVIKKLVEICSLLDSAKIPIERKTEKPTVNKYKKLIFKKTWVSAASELLQDSDAEQMRRAKAILDLLLERSITGKKFLELRCGTGNIAFAALKHNPSLAVGYDTRRLGWNRFNGVVLTDDWDLVLHNAPYDTILLYDVINPTVLQEASDVVADDGLIYVRACPWTSRFGLGNLNVLNKAFCQLFLDDDDLATLGIEPRQKVIHHETYHQWIEQAGLKIRREKFVRHPVEKLFKTPILMTKIKEVCGNIAIDDLSISFIDYNLEKNDR